MCQGKNTLYYTPLFYKLKTALTIKSINRITLTLREWKNCFKNKFLPIRVSHLAIYLGNYWKNLHIGLTL